MKISKRLILALSLLDDPRSFFALINWPKFSLTSFLMVSRLYRQGIRPLTIIDVGANVGQFTIAAAKIFRPKNVYSFEPSPDIFLELKKNVSNLKNIQIFPYALGDREGKVNFRINRYSLSSSLLPLAQAHKDAYPDYSEKQIIQIGMTTLDNTAVHLDLMPPVLMKIDVQGFEEQTLKGALKTLQKVNYVIVETSFEPMYEGEKMFRSILKLMEAQSFHFSRPLDFSYDEKTSKVLQMDAFFIRN